MAFPLALPNPSNFLGVALVINRIREGPRFVFHYPARIFPPLDSTRRGFGDDQIDDDDELYGSVTGASTLGCSREFLPNAGEMAKWNHDDHIATGDGTQFVPWEYVAGLPTKALEGILTPPRAFCKKRFEISLDSICYVSYPVYVPTSGFWNREKGKGAERIRKKPSVDRTGNSDDHTLRESNDGGEKEDKASSMTMFSLVFIFNPKRHEAKGLLDVMYTHVIREVNKVYKYCQERDDFVWQECKKIIQLKERAREDRTRMSVLWERILSASSLATSMRDVYTSVCCNRIAVLELKLGKGSVGHSMQIPMPFHVEDIQLKIAEATRSLLLTTANSAPGYDTLGGLAAFDKCSSLLLTDDDDKKIIAELQARGGKAATAMIELVKAAKPTLSFHQIAQLPETILTIQQIRAYAQHFIYWRRAMAVPPIHARDVYVLSPNCDLGNLSRATFSFAQTFPFAPSLPDLLSSLSVAPRPYKSFCPSKNLRPAYLRILAWLIRGGWVCQLCTFAYVVVWPEIQYEVEYELESEDLARIKQKQQQRESNRDLQRQSACSMDREQDFRPTSVVDNGDSGGEDFSVSSDASYTSPSSSVHDQYRGATDEDARHRPSAAEHAAERARRKRIAEKAAHNLAERATFHARKPVPYHTDHPSMNAATHLVGMLPHVILDAGKPGERENLYLSTIERHLRNRRMTPPPASKKDEGGTLGFHSDHGDETTAWNERIADMWPVFWKYFNGRSALERIALLEDMKRKDVWNLLSAMGEHLICVRHW